MKTPTTPPAEGLASGRGYHVYAFFLLVLIAWQGWMTWGLFGPESTWERLVNDEPIISGTHPANLYLGYLGAKGKLATGSDCCYDPAFQGGYPRTPIFNGSRLAELFLLAGGGEYRPEAYKIGLAIVSLLVPFFFFLAARGTGLGPWSATFGTLLGLLVWWGNPTQKALHAGNAELLLAGLAILVHAGLLVRFHRAPGLGCWVGLLLSGALAWFAQPLLVPIFIPLWLIYYLSVGAKHPATTWHLALLGCLLGAVALNLFWLLDWITFWWLRSPLPQATTILQHRTLQTIWNAPIWGGATDRTLATILLGSAAAGTWIMNQNHQRPEARLLGVGAIGLLILALLGVAWEPLGQMGATTLLPPALFFATVPAAFAWSKGHDWLLSVMGGRRTIAFEIVLVTGLAVLGHKTLFHLGDRCRGPEPFLIGLRPEQKALVEKIIQYTGPEARLLLENPSKQGEGNQWTPLLPLLTGREFVGGLDSSATIEHSSIGLIDQTLNGRHINSWGDTSLEDYCRLYNVGWVVCGSRAVTDRLKKWNRGAELIANLGNGDFKYLFAIKHHVPSYTLKGQAQVVHSDSHHITLANVVPDNGVVVLSLHYQTGMRALPSRIQIEREPSAQDPIGFIRLRVAGPVARVTLTWDDR